MPVNNDKWFWACKHLSETSLISIFRGLWFERVSWAASSNFKSAIKDFIFTLWTFGMSPIFLLAIADSMPNFRSGFHEHLDRI